MQFIEILKLVVSLLPILIDAINTIEQAIPGKGNGQIKLDAIKNIIENTYSASNDISIKLEKLWPTIQNIISGIVTAFNTSSVFKK